LACIRTRRRRWVLDYRDAQGRRHVPSFRTRAEAEEAWRLRVPTVSQRRAGRGLDPQLTLRDWAAQWLRQIAPPILKPRAYEPHAEAMAAHIVPTLGDWPLLELRRGVVRAFLIDRRQRGGVHGRPLAPGSVRKIYSALRACLQAAVEDELLAANVAVRLGGKRGLRLEPTKRERRQRIEARTPSREELLHFFRAVRHRRSAGWYPLLLTYARTGLRLGEAIALEVGDLDLATATLHVRQACNRRTMALEEPKHGPRIIDLSLSPELQAVLRVHVHSLKRAALQRGQPLTRWLFPSQAGLPIESTHVTHVVARLAAAAGLARPRSPHDLRHAYASALVAAGAPIAYVQRQLGHASIQLTVDCYGSAFPIATPTTLVGVLDAPRLARSGNKVVAEGRPSGAPEDVSG
jgi:integrase